MTQKNNHLNYSLIVLIILLLLRFASKIFSTINVLQQIDNILIAIFIGPIFYLSIKSILRTSTKRFYWHYISPALLFLLSIYNNFILEDKDIMLSVILNMLTALLTLFYLIMVVIISNVNRYRSSRTTFIILSFFLLLGSCYLATLAFVGIVEPLYFTDNLSLVNVSVSVPKFYKKIFEIPLLLAFFCISLLLFTRAKNNEYSR
ncbi:hypothetical protein SAMN03097699_1015 [Flavobacteriaceae bacterium MAR_2010_188]|nr:hypothetical protein SAMN03097699_1015 [Flavobacteriaceae bacterium MAR_2010_188]